MWSKMGSSALKVKIIVIGVLSLAIYLLMIIADYPAVVERYYSKGIYLFICRLLHPVFNLFPFSIGDLVYLFVAGYLIYLFFRMLRSAFKRDFKTMLAIVLQLITGIETAVLVFYLFWGMNYFRPSAGERLNLPNSNYTTADLEAVTTIMIDSANATREKVTPADLAQGNIAIYQTAIKAINSLSAGSVNFYTYDPGIKPSILTPFINYMGTTGYYNPFTGEAQMNYQQPVFGRPVTACHELSHQMGYGPEDEANFVGFLAGIRSNDRLLRYSAYHLAVDEFMHALRYRDSTAQKFLKQRVSKAVHQDFLEEFRYWQLYQSQVEVVSSIFYDNFLKANNQPQGLNTYNRMVLLVMAMYKKGFITNKL